VYEKMTIEAYPEEKLELLMLSLKTPDFSSAQKLKEELFKQIDKTENCGALLPYFVMRWLFIDILTVIINTMNQMNIRSKDYDELYFETLYLCQSRSCREKREKISYNMDELLKIFETEYEASPIHISQVLEILQTEFTSPDFSVSTLAERFQVSVAYMSYLFKKKMNQNFSDYLWNMRLQKAQELLLHTDMSIDKISVSVGYINVSSFRRKFKQETGVSPSVFSGRKQ
jgi:YesN/AraC family two-component response regulator